MKNIKKIRFSVVIIAVLLASMFGMGGCQQTAKKPGLPSRTSTPAVKPAAEVTKYKQEPVISLYHSTTGQKEQLKLEEYLKGVVAGEIGPKYPFEALKAQAIVARTMTLALIEYEHGTRGKHGTDASDNHAEFQAYDKKAITNDISRAVDETRGQVLLYNGKFAYTLFHSASGKMTASIEEAFPKLAAKVGNYIRPVPTNGLKNAPVKYRNWTVKIPRSEIKSIMGAKAGSLDDIRISKKGPSGRALTISAGSASIPAVNLRQKVGFDRLYSTLFTSIKASGNYIVFKGQGWGHGAGMEQWGAYTMAKDGKKAKEIVNHYFPGTTWYKMYK